MNKFVVTVTTAATVLVCLVAKTSAFGVARRSVLQNAVVAAGAGIVSSSASSMLLPDDAQAADMIQPMTEPFKVYQVFPDASAALNPTLSQTTVRYGRKDDEDDHGPDVVLFLFLVAVFSFFQSRLSRSLAHSSTHVPYYDTIETIIAQVCRPKQTRWCVVARRTSQLGS